MRKFFLLILPIIVIVSVIITIFGLFQVRYEQDKLMDDLERRTKHIAESMEWSVVQVLQSNNINDANYLVDKFENRERLQGCIIYDSLGNVFALTNRFKDWPPSEASNANDVLKKREPVAETKSFSGLVFYSYMMPVEMNDGTVMGLIEIVHDTSYISSRIGVLWKRISVTLIILIFAIFLILFFIQQQIFILPLQKITKWFYQFQKGETDLMHDIKDSGELGKFASEVEQLALSLRVARKSISERASTKFKAEGYWSVDKLRDLIHAKLGENAIYVVSNREPVMHIHDHTTMETKVITPAGGVVTAIHPILSAAGGTWIAHGSGNADKQFVNSKDKLGIPPGDMRYILKRVWLSKEEEEGYYYGFSNEGLWALCHNTHTRPIFRDKDWQMYKKVNMKFAEAVVHELPANNPLVFIQDYHFSMLGKYIKQKRPDAIVALFWHIPWPNPEAFSICPYQEQILDGMLGCDLIGFHIQNHCNNFLDTANRLLESRVDTERHSVIRFGKETFIRPFPISIDSTNPAESYSPEVLRQVEKLRKELNLENKIVAVGVDRIDYTKGIIERLMAVDRFLEKYSEYRNRFVFIQLGAPSRTHIKRYHELISEIDELVDKINWKYQQENWKPVIYLKRHFSQIEIEPYYALADIGIVSSLHDGMNLVAKEYVFAKKDRSGILLLSQFAGASKELSEAILINPYSIKEFAENIKLAIELPVEEKKRRMQNMRDVIVENNVFKWAGNIISELINLKKGG
jgi:trehalose 6-phosphate synthase